MGWASDKRVNLHPLCSCISYQCLDLPKQGPQKTQLHVLKVSDIPNNRIRSCCFRQRLLSASGEGLRFVVSRREVVQSSFWDCGGVCCRPQSFVDLLESFIYVLGQRTIAAFLLVQLRLAIGRRLT